MHRVSQHGMDKARSVSNSGYIMHVAKYEDPTSRL